VAATARVNISRPEVDEDSIDVSFSRKSVAGGAVSPRLDAQLKCATDLSETNGVFHYPLKVKNYNELVGVHFVPRILIVVLAPSSLGEWTTQTQHSLCLYHCGYWVSLRDLPLSGNSSTVTVKISRGAVFSVKTLQELLPAGEQR
jgi:hypothetical protein